MLDAASQAWFDALRTAHFPPERLAVGAHVTMVHALPGRCEPALAAMLAGLGAATPPFPVGVAGLRFLGRGVAFVLQAPQAAALRRRIAASFASELTPQDRAAWSPHVTVQNKAAPDHARQTHAALLGTAPPGAIRATGLALWRYRGGPWEAVADWPFAATAPDGSPVPARS